MEIRELIERCFQKLPGSLKTCSKQDISRTIYFTVYKELGYNNVDIENYIFDKMINIKKSMKQSMLRKYFNVDSYE